MPLASTPRVDFSQDYTTAAVKGKSALVTGGALGIGGGCAAGLAEAGYAMQCTLWVTADDIAHT
jgi:NADP-dependent 3-hydroxy acid dehydrogenase YdfG